MEAADDNFPRCDGVEIGLIYGFTNRPEDWGHLFEQLRLIAFSLLTDWHCGLAFY
jgi:hypothetical protein